MTTREEAFAPPETVQGGMNVLKGLIWREWLRMRGLVVGALAIWLTLIWVLLIFCHPGLVLAFGVIYVLIGAAGFAGGDALEGSEEFAFSLPPTRGEQYLAKLALGLGTTAAFTALGVLSIALDLPQLIWSVFVNSGFTEPFPVCDEPMVYGLAIAVPVACFACTYAMSANAGTRTMVMVSAFLGVLLAAALMGGGFIAEYALWEAVNGYISIPALLAVAPMALLAGYGFYVRKEGVSRPTPIAGRTGAWVWVVVIVVVVFLLLAFVFLSLRGRVVREEHEGTLMRKDAARSIMPDVEVPERTEEATVEVKPGPSGKDDNGARREEKR